MPWPPWDGRKMFKEKRGQGIAPELSNDFLDIPKAQATKEKLDNLHLIKTKTAGASDDTTKKVNNQQNERKQL